MGKIIFILLFFPFVASSQSGFLGLLVNRPDTISFSGKKVVFFGDSITEGAQASDDAHRWTSFFASLKGATEINYGIGGETLQNEACESRVIFDETTIPTYDNTYAAMFIAFGTNDIGLNNGVFTASVYQSTLEEKVDYAHNTKGWPYKKIILNVPYYGSSTGWNLYISHCSVTTAADSIRQQAYEGAVISVATSKHTCIANPYRAMLGYSTPDDLLSDGIHPNDFGYAFIATYMDGIAFQAQ